MYKNINLGNFISVSNMQSSNGNDIPNQYVVKFENGTVFQSYNSVIAVKQYGKPTILGRNWGYSNTTSKYRNQFLGEDKKATQKKIDSGEYIIDRNF